MCSTEDSKEQEERLRESLGRGGQHTVGCGGEGWTASGGSGIRGRDKG